MKSADACARKGGVMTAEELIEENRQRLHRVSAPYDPVAGDASDSGRIPLDVRLLTDGTIWIPETMRRERIVQELLKCKSLADFRHPTAGNMPTTALIERTKKEFHDLRILHDFEFWAASYVRIKRKGGGEDIPFILNRPQRKLLRALEGMRRAGEPIRLVLLKARQWGGRTLNPLLIYLKILINFVLWKSKL